MAATFGAYRVVGKLGQGGMGEVFLAEHALIGRRAAIKVLHKARTEVKENVERFFNEARATSAVSDPGIVQIYDYGVTPEGVAYLVMEYLEGEPLVQRLNRLGSLPLADALRIARQVSGSLAQAHAAGIVHRDLKPENLFIVRDAEAFGGERPKILDFGIAKLEDERPDRFKTRAGAVMGTPVYMSPEQSNDTTKTDHRTDIYSLGCVVFHLITGQPPFDVHGIGALISAHQHDPPRPPSSVMPDVPLIVDQLILRCLAKLPSDRFANMLELQAACDEALAVVSGLAPSVPAPPRTFAAPPASSTTTTLGHSAGQTTTADRRPRIALWLGVTAVAIVVGVGVAVVAMHGRGDGEQFLAAPIAPPPAVAIDAAPPIDAVAIDAPAVDAARPAVRKQPRPGGPPEDLYEDR